MSIYASSVLALFGRDYFRRARAVIDAIIDAIYIYISNTYRAFAARSVVECRTRSRGTRIRAPWERSILVDECGLLAPPTLRRPIRETTHPTTVPWIGADGTGTACGSSAESRVCGAFSGGGARFSSRSKATVTHATTKYRFLAQGARDGRWIHKLSSGGWVRRGDIKVDMWMPGNECRPVRIVTY